MGLRKQKSLIEKAQDVADQVKPQVESALEQASELAQEGLKHAAPLIATGKVATAAGLAHAVDAASSAAGSAHDFVEAKKAELRPAPKKSKAGVVRKVLLFTGLAAVLGVVAKKLTATKEADKWQPAATPSRPTPAPSPASSTSAAAAAEGDDPAGADPAEALADATEAPHPVTTPDNPADVVDVPPVEGYSTGKSPSQQD